MEQELQEVGFKKKRKLKDDIEHGKQQFSKKKKM